MSEQGFGIGTFLSGTFLGGAGGIKWGSVLLTVLGGAGGYWMGGGIGAVLGLLAGTALSGVTMGPAGKTQPGAVAPGLEAPRKEENAQALLQHYQRPQTCTAPELANTAAPRIGAEKVNLTLSGQAYAVTLPKEDAFKTPWSEGLPSSYIHGIGQDTLRVAEGPETGHQEPGVLLRAVTLRNEEFYRFLRSQMQAHAMLEQYNAKDRPAIMQRLGIEDGDTLAPPAYRGRLSFASFMGKDAESETQAVLQISADNWNKLDEIDKAAHIEKALATRMLNASRKFAGLKSALEEQGRQQPWDIDLSGNSGIDRVKSIFGYGFENDISAAIREYGESLPSRHADKRFTEKMEALIARHVAQGQYGGEKAAKLMREQVALIVEDRNLRVQFNALMLQKEDWAKDAGAWAGENREFVKRVREDLEKAKSQTVSTADFTLLKESPFHIIRGKDGPRAGKLREEIRHCVDKYNLSVHQLKLAFTCLNVGEGANGYLFLLQPLEEKYIRELPQMHDLQGRKEAGPGDKDLHAGMLSGLKAYNDAVAAYKADKGNHAKTEALQNAHAGMVKELGAYLTQRKEITEAFLQGHRAELAQLEKQSMGNEALQGAQGVQLRLVDKRGGANKPLHLVGVKRGNEYVITGWAEEEYGVVQAPRYFGGSATDFNAGLPLDVKTLGGLNGILQKIAAMPAPFAIPVEPPKEETKTSSINLGDIIRRLGGSPEGGNALAAAKPKADFAPASVLAQALASVTFKPVGTPANLPSIPAAQAGQAQRLAAA